MPVVILSDGTVLLPSEDPRQSCNRDGYISIPAGDEWVQE